MHLKIGRKFRFSVNKSTVKCYLNLRNLHLYSILSMNPKVQTLGVANRLSDNRFVFFGDYDSVLFSVVREEVMRLQNLFHIGSAAIISTGGIAHDDSGREYSSYHVIAVGKMKYWDVIRCLDETSVDVNFKRVPFYFNQRAWVLRIFPKFQDGSWEKLRERPVLREVIWSKTKRECSSAMYDLLRMWYNIGEFPDGFMPKLDGLKTVRIIKYQTTSETWGSVLRSAVGLDIIKKMKRKR